MMHEHVLHQIEHVVCGSFQNTEEALGRIATILDNVPQDARLAINDAVLRWARNRMYVINTASEFLATCERHPDHRRFLDGSTLTRARKRRTAVHEAGHAVVGSEFGHDPRLVSIITRRKERSNGRVLWSAPEVFGHFDGIVVLMAGEIAVRRLLGRQRRSGEAGDMLKVGMLLASFNGNLSDEELRDKFAKHFKVTVAFVDKHMEKIAHVACLLLEHRELRYHPLRGFEPVGGVAAALARKAAQATA
jgi:hypothetical protein